MGSMIDEFAKTQPQFEKPSTEPWFPEDITESTHDEVGQLLGLYTKWINYASQEEAKDSARLGILKEDLEIESAKELVKIAQDTTLKAAGERNAYVKQLPSISKLMREIAQLEGFVRIEKSVLNNFESRYASASRELTRRG